MKSENRLQAEFTFINRELSWLEFNKRVLELSNNESLPLFERIKFLGIFASNLNEFFMIRVAGVRDQMNAGIKKDASNISPSEIYQKIRKKVLSLYKIQGEYIRNIINFLGEKNIFINSFPHEKEAMIEFIFNTEILPLITPVTLGNTNPIPFISNNRTTILIKLKKQDEIYHSVIIIPENIEKVFIKEIDNKTYYLTNSYIVKKMLSDLFYGFEILEIAEFKITRDADLTIEDEGAEDLLKSIEKSLDLRKKGKIVRFEINNTVSQELLKFICDKLDIKEDEIYYFDQFSDCTFFLSLKSNEKSFFYQHFNPKLPTNIDISGDIFQQIKSSPILLYRPYYDFGLISNLVKQASEDKNTLAIKMTIYRVNNDSSIVKSLITAAKNGKTVSVVVELKARFDEENNLELAKQLEEAGCIVTYGFGNTKVHSKLLLIIRREDGAINSYAHISTGNYNEKTARQYTDIDYITSEKDVCKDVMSIFNYLMGYMDNDIRSRVFISPNEIKPKLINLIDNEIKHASEGKKASIIIKVNSLIDRVLIKKLYEASMVGVKIQLIVRGICGIVPGIKGISKNISVKSIVGRFLEHPRIFYFHNGGRNRTFIASADFMERNMDRRIEAMLEIYDKNVQKKLFSLLNSDLKDTENSWILSGEEYFKVKSTKRFDCHSFNIKNKILG